MRCLTAHLYKAMKKTLYNPDLGERMGEESKRIIEEGFRYEHMVQGFRTALSGAYKNERCTNEEKGLW